MGALSSRLAAMRYRDIDDIPLEAQNPHQQSPIIKVFGMNQTILDVYSLAPIVYKVRRPNTVAVMRETNGRLISNGTLPVGAYVGLLDTLTPISYRSVDPYCDLEIVLANEVRRLRDDIINLRVSIIQQIPGFASVPNDVAKKIFETGDLTLFSEDQIKAGTHNKVFTTQSADPGALIIQKDADANDIVFLMNGTADVVVNDVVVATYYPMVSVFGEAAFIQGQKRTANVRARTSCDMVRIHVANLQELLNKDDARLKGVYALIRDTLLENWNMSQFNNTAHLGAIEFKVAEGKKAKFGHGRRRKVRVNQK